MHIRPAATPSQQSPATYVDPLVATMRARARLLTLVRIGFVFVLISAGMIRLYALGQTTATSDLFLARHWYLPITVAVIMAALFIAIDLLTPSKKIATLVSVSVGLLVGVTATIACGFVIDFLAEIYALDKGFVFMVKVFLGICLSFLGVTLVLQTQDDVRLVIPYVEFAKQLRGPRPLLIDSSALIDARFADALQTGFFQAPIVIPRFIIAELQQLADSSDRLKRARGRRALDIIARMRRHTALDVTIDPTHMPGMGADQALVELAARTRGLIVTTDSGLARIATIQGATVLNVNDLATALRPALAAGEVVSVRLVKPGEQAGQAVGYLADGTMIVAEDGGPFIGREVPLMVISTLQTSAGRLVFARTDRQSEGAGEPRAASATREDDHESTTESVDTDDSQTPSSMPGFTTGDSSGDSSGEPDGPDAGEDGVSQGGSGSTPNTPRPGPFPPRGSQRPKNRFRNPRR
ncbi:MAG TPA: hypothetical protein VK176_10130 [Phycisphaerales bacterium]|nr:hypothetical protein [Phycisphaerales bacterium]